MNKLVLDNVCLNLSEEFKMELSFKFSSNKIYSIIGENGSGKTSLVDIISSLYPIDDGKITYLNNGNVEDFRVVRTVKPEDLYENLPIYENVCASEYNNYSQGIGINFEKMQSDCKDIFKKFDLDINPCHSINKVGFAKKQVISLMKLYIADADVYIFDEPTSLLGEKEKNIFYEILQTLKEKNKIIIFITHNFNEAINYSNEILVLRNGKIINNYDNNVSEDTLLKSIMGDKSNFHFPKVSCEIGKKIFEINNIYIENKLNNISLSLHQGEVVGICGKMGSGRSVLAHYIYGNVSHNYPTVILDDKKVKIKSPIDCYETVLPFYLNIILITAYIIN